MRALRRSFALAALVTACASGSKPEAEPGPEPSEGGSAGASGGAGARAGSGGKAAGGSSSAASGAAGATGGSGLAGAAGAAGASGTAGQGGQAGQAGAAGGAVGGNAGSAGQGGKPAEVCGKFVAECDCGGVRGTCVAGVCDCAHSSPPRAEDNVLTCAEAKLKYPSPSWEAIKGTCDVGRVCLAMPPESAAESSNGWGDRFCRVPPNPALPLGGIDEGVGKKIYQYCCLPVIDGAGGAGGQSGAGGSAGAAGKAGGGGTSAGTGGTSAGTGGTSAGTGGTAAGTGGTSAGTGGTSAGTGGTSAGTGGTSAGAGGTSAGAGGSNPGCVVASPPAECACVSARNATGRGVEQCLPGATSPTCDCRNAKPVSADTNAPPCGKVEAQTSSFKLACVNDTELPDCRLVVDPGTWVSKYCAAPLGGSTQVQPINGGPGNTYCCKPVDGKPQPICDLPPEPTCESSDDPRTQGVIGTWACNPQNAAAICKLGYAQPFPAQNDLRPCAQATELTPKIAPNQCGNEPLFSRCLVTATSQAWAKANCAYLNDASGPNGASSKVYCCLPPKP